VRRPRPLVAVTVHNVTMSSYQRGMEYAFDPDQGLLLAQVAQVVIVCHYSIRFDRDGFAG